MENSPKRHVTDEIRALRERAGLTMAEMAKALGYRGPSSYQRYEDPQVFIGPVLSLKLAKRLAGALKGRGHPPIEANEIYALAGVEMNQHGQAVMLEEPGRSGLRSKKQTPEPDATAQHRGASDFGMLDIKRLATTIQFLEEWLVKTGRKSTPEKKANAIVLLYLWLAMQGSSSSEAAHQFLDKTLLDQ